MLDGVIQTAAARAGFSVADVRSAFTGHEICEGRSSLAALDAVQAQRPTDRHRAVKGGTEPPKD